MSSRAPRGALKKEIANSAAKEDILERCEEQERCARRKDVDGLWSKRKRMHDEAWAITLMATSVMKTAWQDSQLTQQYDYHLIGQVTTVIMQ